VTFRQDAHLVSLIVWAVLSAGVAVFLFVHSKTIVDRDWQLNEIAAGGFLLLFGPVALGLYILRARLMWVEVDPDRGLVLNGSTLIPWADVDHIERKCPLFRKSTGPAQLTQGFDPSAIAADGCFPTGCAVSEGEGLLLAGGIILLFAAFFVIWFVVFVFIPLIAVPVIEVFAPLGDRIRIVGKHRSLLLRDLRHADRFIESVRPHVPIVER
jgi:amino acid transporter